MKKQAWQLVFQDIVASAGAAYFLFGIYGNVDVFSHSPESGFSGLGYSITVLMLCVMAIGVVAAVCSSASIRGMVGGEVAMCMRHFALIGFMVVLCVSVAMSLFSISEAIFASVSSFMDVVIPFVVATVSAVMCVLLWQGDMVGTAEP